MNKSFLTKLPLLFLMSSYKEGLKRHFIQAPILQKD